MGFYSHRLNIWIESNTCTITINAVPQMIGLLLSKAGNFIYIENVYISATTMSQYIT